MGNFLLVSPQFVAALFGWYELLTMLYSSLEALMSEVLGWDKVRVFMDWSNWDNKLGELCSWVFVLYMVLIGSLLVYV